MLGELLEDLDAVVAVRAEHALEELLGLLEPALAEGQRALLHRGLHRRLVDTELRAELRLLDAAPERDARHVDPLLRVAHLVDAGAAQHVPDRVRRLLRGERGVGVDDLPLLRVEERAVRREAVLRRRDLARLAPRHRRLVDLRRPRLLGGQLRRTPRTCSPAALAPRAITAAISSSESAAGATTFSARSAGRPGLGRREVLGLLEEVRGRRGRRRRGRRRRGRRPAARRGRPPSRPARAPACRPARRPSPPRARRSTPARASPPPSPEPSCAFAASSPPTVSSAFGGPSTSSAFLNAFSFSAPASSPSRAAFAATSSAAPAALIALPRSAASRKAKTTSRMAFTRAASTASLLTRSCSFLPVRASRSACFLT